jgi:hypothetical protein
VSKLLTCILLACTLGTVEKAEQWTSSDAALTAVRFKTMANDPVAVRGFLQRFPKGADLHIHLSGAVYAETYVEWAVEDGLCLLLVHWAVTAPPCDAAEGRPPIAEALDQRVVTRDQVINAWSLRGFVAGQPTGHEQFFASFGRFGAAIEGRTGEMLAEVAARAGAQNVRYLELMASYGTWAASDLGARSAGIRIWTSCTGSSSMQGWRSWWGRLEPRSRATSIACALSSAAMGRLPIPAAT